MWLGVGFSENLFDKGEVLPHLGLRLLTYSQPECTLRKFSERGNFSMLCKQFKNKCMHFWLARWPALACAHCSHPTPVSLSSACYKVPVWSSMCTADLTA